MPPISGIRWRFKGDVILFQVGNFFEFYSKHDKEIGRLPGLSRIKGAKQFKRNVKYGFPVNMLEKYLDRLLRLNSPRDHHFLRGKMSVTIVGEKERYFSGIKERVPMCRIEYS